MTKVAQFEIHQSAFIGADGEELRPLPANLDDKATLAQLYRWMVLTRCFDAKAVALQRTGRLGTFASSLGQEAVSVGVGHAMRPEDVLVPSFREHGTQLYRGVRIEELLLYWGGDERGSDFLTPREDFPVCVTVGGHAPHAAGVALSFKLRGEERAAVCVFGDGATSKGDVYEAMNLAGVWSLPVVFVVTNNQWAISTPRAEQTAAETLAQKAVAVGFDGEQVDGNDVIAVADTVSRALEKARTGNGPHLIECLTYRLADHTTSDDASRYRDDVEVSQWWHKDPLARLRIYLTEHAKWGKDDEANLIDSCNEQVEVAVQAYLAMPPQSPESIFDFMFADLPRDLQRQREEMLRFADSSEGTSGG
jgi:2-oxoisovalerate dehydrogenase E1 component alpha subunit